MYLAAEGLKRHPMCVMMKGIHKQASELFRDPGRAQFNNPFAPGRAQFYNPFAHLSDSCDSDFSRSAAIVKGLGVYQASQNFLDPHFKAIMNDSYLALTTAKPADVRDVEAYSGPRPEEFCSKYFDSQMLPVSCDTFVSFKMLHQCSSWTFCWWFKLASNSPAVQPREDSDVARQHHLDSLDPMPTSADNHGMRNFRDPRHTNFSDIPLGSVRFVKRSSCGAGTSSLMSFSDVPQHAMQIPVHGMHVAVNFTDLGVLAETVITQQQKNEELDSQPSLDTNCVRMLQWVGVEQCSFSCAKTLVILQMLRRGANVGNIVQVAFPLHASVLQGGHIGSSDMFPEGMEGIHTCLHSLRLRMLQCKNSRNSGIK